MQENKNMTDAIQYPIFYSFRRCPYAMRARLAVYLSGTPVILREVILRDKPQAMLKASPKATVPVMVLPDGTVLEESFDIVEYALNKQDPYGLLSCDLVIAKELITKNDTSFKAALDRYKYPNRYPDEDTSNTRDIGEEFLQKLDVLLKENTHLIGPKLSLADICIFPFIRQFANTDKDWFDSLPYKYVQKWLTRLLESDAFESIMEKYGQWKEGDAAIVFGNVS